MKNPKVNSIKAKIKQYFSPAIFVGFIFVLIGIVIRIKYFDNDAIFIKVIIDLLEMVGISLIVASIFSFIASTQYFMNMIGTFLEDIILDRKFLSNIDQEAKKEAIKYLVQPSDLERNNYPSIGDYYGFFIEKTLDISKRSVRSNYQVHNTVYLENERIVTEGLYRYRLYPNKDGFSDIVIGFEDPDSFCQYIRISKPNGDCLTFNKDATNNEQSKYHKQLPELNSDKSDSGDITYRTKIEKMEIDLFSKECTNCNHLDIELLVFEKQRNNQQAFLQFKALQPTDGFVFDVSFSKELEKVSHAIFVVDAKYQVNEQNNKFSITCHQWINEGSGVAVLLLKKEQ